MQHLLLLHGAIGSSAQLTALERSLQPYFHVYLFDFPGHGGKEIPDEFSIQLFAQSVVDFLNENKLIKVSIFGYSMGGYVAMYLAKHYPSLVDHIVTLATKFEWNENIAAKEIKMLQPELIETKLPSFAEVLKQRHTPQDWKQVLNATAAMLMNLGKENTLKSEDYSTIHTPSLVMLGDRDKMISFEETVAVYHHLPAAQFAVLPSMPHPIEQVDVDMLAFFIRRFCTTPA